MDERVDTTTPVTGRSDAGNWAKPTGRLAVTDARTGAVDLNVSGRRLHGAAHGFGRLWQKTFSVRLEGANITPQQVIRVWKERFGDFWPERRRMFLPVTGIAPGEVGIIDDAATVPVGPALKTGILVIYADDESFSFMSPEGHPFAGPLTFSAYDDAGTTVVQVQELTRASDPIWELMLMTPVLGPRMQNEIWRTTLRNLAASFGATTEVQARIVCVDTRRQWRHAKNIVNNAGIRSTLYALGAPLRMFRR